MKARPGYVKRQLAFRRGECGRCGMCCAISFRCPHYDGAGCRNYDNRYAQCRAFPIDARDTRLIRRMGGECGFRFDGAPASRFPITRHGTGPLLLAAAVCGAAAAGAAFFVGWYAVALLAPVALVAFFFRDPERRCDEDAPNAVLAPADGKVVRIAEAAMPLSGGAALMIDIFLSIFDVHINRVPVSGTVVETRYEKGMFLNALRAEAGERNENNVIALCSRSGSRFEVKQISGAIARRIVCTVRPGEEVAAGERLGMIKFGSRTQLFIPAEAGFEPRVVTGERVRAGSTVLGYIR